MPKYSLLHDSDFEPLHTPLLIYHRFLSPPPYRLKNVSRLGDIEDDVPSKISISRSQLTRLLDIIPHSRLRQIVYGDPKSRFGTDTYYEWFERLECELILLSPPPPPLYAIVVSAAVLLFYVYFYLIGYTDRGRSTAGSSSSLDIRDIYISIILFRAAYVWIKFRDVNSVSKGAVYRRRGSSKWEPRIKFPGGTGQRLPLSSYDSFEEAEVVYRIAAFYCNKPKHRLGRLNLGGGAYFHIPTFNVDPILPYKEKVKQVGDQVLKVYAEFEEQKTSRNLSPHVLGQALETSTEGGQRLTTPPIQQPQEPVNSGLDLTMQGQGSQHASNTCNGVHFDNPNYVRQELLEANEEIHGLKAQLSRKENECNELKQKHSELEGLLEQSQLRERDFDPDTVFDFPEHEESLTS